MAGTVRVLFRRRCFEASYTVYGDVLSVSSTVGLRSGRLGRLPPEQLARKLLLELVATAYG